MGKLAVVTEKESVARDIASALGGFTKGDNSYESDRYVVMWAVGHILGLPAPEEIDPKYKRWVLQDLPILPKKFDLKPLEGMKGRLDQMAKTFRRKEVEGIVNACDAGREGELIFREIIEYTGTDKPIQRLWLQSMTTDAIRDGFARLLPGSKFDGLANAAWCRSEADWLVGMNATRAVTKRLQSRKAPEVWSAGRVQTPTLAMLVDHEFKILEFEPRDYWRIEGEFQASDHVYTSTWFDPNWKGDPEQGEKEDRILDRGRAETILSGLQGQLSLASETRKPERESAPLLFDLTTLQREANRRFSFSARRTLQAAQRLYEGHKVLTYPRTDSRHLPEDYGPHVHQVLETFSSVSPYAPFAAKLLREGLLNRERVFDNAKISDHFAIIPTGVVPKGLEGDDAKIFDFVMRRFLAVFYPQAIWNRVERLTRVGEEHFRVRSRTLQVAGWREVIGTEDGAEERLPPLVPGRDQSEGVSVTPLDFKLEEDVTRPPARITEGRLLGMMERAGKELEDEELSEIMADKGLGTPATRADTIENLISKGYVRRLREGLKPTAKGIRLIDFLHRIDTSGLASAELTGEWEKHLREVEHGAMRRASFMEGISDFTRGVVERIKEFQYDELYAKDGPVGPCPFNSNYPVVEFLWGYRCQAAADNNGDGCKEENCASSNGFVIWKETSGRYIDRKTASKLARERKTGTLAGFSDRQGREYQATLQLDEENQVRVVGNGAPDSAHDEETHTGETLGPCPCGQDCEVIETTTRYVCKRLQEAGPRAKAKDASSCGFALPKLVCKREITFEEAKEYLANGRTGVLEGFISRWNRPFPAVLFFRKDDGRFGFEFPPREGKKGSGSEKTGSRRPRTKAAARGAAKKTTAKRTTRKGSAKKT
ncbi:MAG: topoisomerase C-terminal repeat-containing protein [Candidatus Omnitrophica bacterium]|nr:DNA topoisomerase 3 [bacterium]NUN97101.1 topoisomerase C-terminal repeat-containing protein [Candidatus Omnitrophota bacterium]